MIVYNNFNWNKRVQYKTISSTHKYISTTISKLILNPKFPQGGLYTYILKPTVKLTYSIIFNYPSNQVNYYTEQCWQYWITKTIIYTLPKVKEVELFNLFQPNIPLVDYLPL